MRHNFRISVCDCPTCTITPGRTVVVRRRRPLVMGALPVQDIRTLTLRCDQHLMQVKYQAARLTASERSTDDHPHPTAPHAPAGRRKPAGAIVVARPTPFGQPVPRHQRRLCGRCHPIRGLGNRPHAQPVRCGSKTYTPPMPADLESLRGKDLCCGCPLDGPCHADVLLELANPTTERTHTQ